MNSNVGMEQEEQTWKENIMHAVRNLNLKGKDQALVNKKIPGVVAA
jgi:hypothetical protein